VSAYRWLCGDVGVNHRILSEFRNDQGARIEQLLCEHVASLSAAGLIDLDEVAQDGVRIRASAGAASFRRRKTLESELAKATAASLAEIKALGLKTIMIPRVPGKDRNGQEIYYSSAACKPFWDAIEAAGLPVNFHIGEGVSKIISCVRGEILDVLVDIRRSSPTYGQWEAFPLDGEALRILYAPVGFAHGFCVLSEVADVIYQQSAYYSDDVERGFSPSDPEVAIDWPIPADERLLSDRDLSAPLLAEVADSFDFA
jgi:hypothetical protein